MQLKELLLKRKEREKTKRIFLFFLIKHFFFTFRSRLLLVVFGAEHRRLQAAGLKLLDTCARNKAFAVKFYYFLKKIKKSNFFRNFVVDG